MAGGARAPPRGPAGSFQTADSTAVLDGSSVASDRGRWPSNGEICHCPRPGRPACRVPRRRPTTGLGPRSRLRLWRTGRRRCPRAPRGGYLSSRDSEERTRQWIANGQLVRRQMAQSYGMTSPDEERVNWEEASALQKKWRAVTMGQRARDAGLSDLYDVLYLHGCSSGHSDAWSAGRTFSQPARLGSESGR
jgi:hypothetical protein